MRIAVWHNLPSGGGKRALFNQIKGLKQSGHYIESWCPQTASQDFLPLGQLIKENIIPVSEKLSGSLFKHEMYNYYMNISKKVKAMKAHSQLCANEINEKGFDLLFANTCHSTIVPYISRYVKIPKLLYLQEPNRKLYEANDTLPWIAPEKAKSLSGVPAYCFKVLKNAVKTHILGNIARDEHINIKLFDLVLANSYYSIESIYRAYGVKAKLNYLGVDLNVFKYKKMKRENFVIGIGAFHLSKNIEFILNSISQIKNNRPKLVWVGNTASGPYLDSLVKLSDSLKVDFEFHMNISDKELVKFLNSAKLMVYAPHLEPFGFAPIEAGACRLPVITIHEGGMRETVSNMVNGLIVEYEEERIAEAIELILNDEELAVKLGKNGYKMVLEKWSLESSAKDLEEKFHQVISK